MVQTKNQINTTSFNSTTEVRQVGSTGCSLFTLYINETIQAINSYGPDGFLKDLHCILLMDGTVVFSTSRRAMQRKLMLLKNSTDFLNMKLHPRKSKYMCINSQNRDSFILDGGISIDHTTRYIYLGNIITNEPMSTQVKNNIDSKECHIHKYASFLRKSSEAPFLVKKRVLESALNNTISPVEIRVDLEQIAL
jgi:hypothetical protein